MLIIRHLTMRILPAVLFFFCLNTANAQFLPNNSGDAEEEKELPTDVYGRTTPRGTVNGFIKAVADLDYDKASQFLNLKGIRRNRSKEELVLSLQRILDEGSLVHFSKMSNDYNGNEADDLASGIDQVGTFELDGEAYPIYVELTEGAGNVPVWLFSRETIKLLARVDIEKELLVDKILPPFLKNKLWGGVPVGQWLLLVVFLVIAYFIMWVLTILFIWLLKKVWVKSGVDPAAGVIKALALPLKIFGTVWLFMYFSEEAGVSIILRQKFSGLLLIIGVIAILLLLWRLTKFIGNFVNSRMLKKGNASGMSIVLFLQRAAKVAILIIGFIIILDVFGVDVTAGLAALGIGGIALALGAQKSVENFVGSVTLITDQPVRVGDFCKVGDTLGTVERIGMRSTRIRTLNRTIVTIPNGEFSSKNIENFAHRDRFLFQTVLNLRYETSPDQIRFLLVEIRKILYSHPMVSPDPARIRFVSLGSASIDLEIFSYLLAPSFDAFLEIKEDLLLRIMDTVKGSGTDFAFPSQTIYIARDSGLSDEKTKSSEAKVKEWRENKEMPIPGFNPEQIEELKDSIEYPPEGSVNRMDNP